MSAHLPAAVERMRRVQLVDPSHQRQGLRIRLPCTVIQARAAQPQQPALQAEARLRVAPLDQALARGPAQRSHALRKKWGLYIAPSKAW